MICSVLHLSVGIVLHEIICGDLKTEHVFGMHVKKENNTQKKKNSSI